MKHGLWIVAGLLGLFATVGLFAGPLPGIPVFGDDFGVTGLFVENWNMSKGTKCEDGRAIIPAGNDLTLRRVQDGDFALTADLIVEKPEGKDRGHCGVILDGIHFMLTPSSPLIAHTAYRVPGEERSRGNTAGAVPGLEFGKPCQIAISREKLGKGFKYSYKVNGTAVDSFQVAMPANGKVSFYGYKTSLVVDNFQLYAIKGGDGSSNLVVNSSFEYLQEGMPNYMMPKLGGKYRFAGKWEEFISAFAIDTKEKMSGRQSVRMACREAGPTGNGVSTFNVSVMAKTPVTFSIYLKASEDNFPATLLIWELWHKSHREKITLSKEWKRYSITAMSPERAVVRGWFEFAKPGTVWADDLQVEIGTEATPYKPSPLDKDKYPATTAREEPRIDADTVLRKATKAPVMDGDLEDTWFSSGKKVDRFFLNSTETPANRTEAYLTCDDDNLYLAVRAYVPDTAKVKGAKLERDNLAAHGDDCIEVFLDPTFSRKNYYHLTTNAAGSRTDFGSGRVKAWDGNWEAATKINEKEKSIDYEMKFPLALFADAGLAGKWGLNIGRNDTSVQKVYSLIHVKEANFHVPELYPAIVFPDDVAARYKVGVQDLRLVAGKDGGISVSGTIGNLSGKPLEAELQILAGATGEILGRKDVTLANGNTEVRVPVTATADVKALDVTAKILVDGQERYSQPKRLALVRPLEFYTRYNYYMNEATAVLVGSLHLPDADKLSGRVTVAGKTFDVTLAPEFAVDIPLAGIPNGEHQMTMDVVSGADTLTSATTRLVKREFKAGATQIDHQRRCLVVDGKPYLAITPFFGVERGIKPETQETILKNMLRLHTDMGYRCFLAGAVDDALVPKQAQEFFDLCAKAGVKIIYWPFQSWKKREQMTPEQRLQTLNCENIIAWLVVDEPELYAKSEEVEAFMEAHRKASPYTPVFMNNTIVGIPGRYAGLKTDILMLDDYLCNRENRKVAEVIHATDMMWEAGREDRKPVFYFLEGENLPNHYRECTYAEQIAETYGVIIAGGTGVSYFCSLPLYPEDYRASVDVNRELLALEEVIFSLEKTASATVSNPVVRFMTRKLNGKLYVIALNIDNDRSAKADITFPPEFTYVKRADVKFENRNLKLKKGRISDTFKPLERHVYVVDIVPGDATKATPQ